MVTKLLKTTIQFGLCALSISKFASVGIDTFGSSVQCKRSEIEILISVNESILFVIYYPFKYDTEY